MLLCPPSSVFCSTPALYCCCPPRLVEWGSTSSVPTGSCCLTQVTTHQQQLAYTAVAALDRVMSYSCPTATEENLRPEACHWYWSNPSRHSCLPSLHSSTCLIFKMCLPMWKHWCCCDYRCCCGCCFADWNPANDLQAMARVSMAVLLVSAAWQAWCSLSIALLLVGMWALLGIVMPAQIHQSLHITATARG